MKSEYIESEIIKDKIAKVQYETNILYSSIFNTISLLLNERMFNNPNEIILFTAKESYGKVTFQFDILNDKYEENPGFYDEKIFELIRELSKISVKDIIVKNNLTQKFPSILNLVPEKINKNKNSLK